MSIINIISNDEVTLVQGVDGLFFLRRVMDYAKQGGFPVGRGVSRRSH